MKLSEELTWRGFVNQTTYKDLSALDGEPITFYWGVDPSADSMTIGNLAAAMMVKAFIKHGHRAILLIGGATGLIGDPDGKKAERELKSPEEIAKNKQAIIAQYRQVFSEHQVADIVDNYKWFEHMHYLDFLREYGKHVPMRQMLTRDFVQKRLVEGGSGISYAEFSYVLIQAYDFLYLYNNYGVRLQVCGSDQWGNSIAGVDLIRRKAGGEAQVFSAPLMLDKTSGQKFGKSEAGAVWLDPAKTSLTQFYQFWVNVDDDGVEDYLKIYTELSKDELDRLMAEFNQNRAERLAQKTLAIEVTKLVHGPEAANTARTEASALKLPVSDTVHTDEKIGLLVATNASIAETLVNSHLASSKSEARQLMSSGGIYINDEPVNRDNFEASDFENDILKLRRGKTLQNTVIIRKADA